MPTDREGVPGTGLPAAAYAFVLAVSVGLFLAWNGLLWRAPRGASHVARFAISYGAVIPLAAVLLLSLHQFRWSRLVATTGSVWAIKLVVTALLYVVLARGTAAQMGVAALPLRMAAPAAATVEYRAAPAFAAAGLRGRVLLAGAPVDGAVVFLDHPPAGRPRPAGALVELVLTASRYDSPLYLVSTEDDVRLANHDMVLHTVHFLGSGRLPANRPAPPSSVQTLEVPEPGVYRIRCDTHPGEGAWVAIVDHPYATRTDGSGAFSLAEVPAGALRVTAVSADARGGLSRASTAVVARPDETLELRLDLEPLSQAVAP